MSVLLADDHAHDIEGTITPLLEGVTLQCVTRADRVLNILAGQETDLVLLDLRFDGQETQGLDIVDDIKSKHPSVPVIVYTALEDIDLAQELHKDQRIFWYIVKDEDGPGRGFRDKVRAALAFSRRAKFVRSQKLNFIDQDTTVLLGTFPVSMPNIQYALYKTAAEAALRNRPGVGPSGWNDSGWIAFSDFYDPRSHTMQYFLDAYEASFQHAIKAPERLRELLEMSGDLSKTIGLREDAKKEIRSKITQGLAKLSNTLAKSVPDREILMKFLLHQKPLIRGKKRISTFGLCIDPQDIILPG